MNLSIMITCLVKWFLSQCSRSLHQIFKENRYLGHISIENTPYQRMKPLLIHVSTAIYILTLQQDILRALIFVQKMFPITGSGFNKLVRTRNEMKF